MNNDQNFWQRYGKVLVLSIILVLSATALIQYRDGQKTKTEQQASLVYEKMLGASRKQEIAQIKESAKELIENYSSTSYGALAALMLARLEIEDHNVEKAIDHLKVALKISKKGAIHEIATLRLARVLLNENRFDEALAALPNDKQEQGFKVLIEELRGDIYYKQKDIKKAAQAYSDAIKAAPQGLPLMSLQLKYSDIKSQEDS